MDKGKWREASRCPPAADSNPSGRHPPPPPPSFTSCAPSPSWPLLCGIWCVMSTVPQAMPLAAFGEAPPEGGKPTLKRPRGLVGSPFSPLNRKRRRPLCIFPGVCCAMCDAVFHPPPPLRATA